jgi:hypothetical protein
MLRSRIGKIAVAGVVFGASLSLWPATARAKHQPECPYPHKDGEQWTRQQYAPDSEFHRRIDRNNNGVLCFLSVERGVAVRDDVDPNFDLPTNAAGGLPAAETVPIFRTTRISCGGDNQPAEPTVGFANIRSDGNGPVVAQVSLKDARPNTTYDFILLQTPGGNCGPSRQPDGSITTNAQGNGNAKLSAAKRPGATGAFVFSLRPEQFLASGHYVFGSK